MKNRIEPDADETQETSEPRINWDPELPRSENLKREATDLLPGVTFATLFDAVDLMVRKQMVRDSKVDFPITVLRVRKQLDALLDTYLRRNDLDKAFGVLREQIKLLSLENHIQPLTESDLRASLRDPYSHAMRDLDPADRHRVVKKRQAFDDELRREVFEKTGRNPDGSERPFVNDTPDLEPNPQEGCGGADA